MWNPVLGEVHCLALEEGNERDRFAVSVKRDEIIGHVPFLRHGGDQRVKSLEQNEKTDWRCRVGNAS